MELQRSPLSHHTKKDRAGKKTLDGVKAKIYEANLLAEGSLINLCSCPRDEEAKPTGMIAI
jgi:hypothetical protein